MSRFWSIFEARIERMYRHRYLFFYILMLQWSTTWHFFSIYPWTWSDLLGTFFSTTALSALIIFFLGLIRSKKVTRWLSVGVMLVISLLYLGEGYLLSTYVTPYTDSIAMGILSTNPDEASSFLHSPISYITLLRHLLVILFWLFVFWGLHYLDRWIHIRSPKRVLYLIPLVMLTLFSGSVSQIRKRPSPEQRYSILTSADRLIYGTWICYQQTHHQYARFAETNRRFGGKVSPATLRGKHNIVVVVGESLRRNDMHCYGYPLPNTPHIDALVQSGDLILFSDVVSPDVHTAQSLSEVFTYHHLDDKLHSWDYYPSLMNIMHKGGYYTYWLSNQERIGLYMQTITEIAQTAQSSYWSQDKRREYPSRKIVPYDEALVPHLVYASEEHPRLMQFVHLMGSHASFYDRYPHPSFDWFTEKDIHEPLRKDQKKLSAEYMNSIAYNDFVIGEIVSRYSQEPSVVIYFSDHGLARYDFSMAPESFVHCPGPPGHIVPFMVYLSPAFQAQNPEICQAIRQASDKPYMLDLLPWALEGLTGVRSPFYDPRKDLFSDRYDSLRPRRVSSYTLEIEL